MPRPLEHQLRFAETLLRVSQRQVDMGDVDGIFAGQVERAKRDIERLKGEIQAKEVADEASMKEEFRKMFPDKPKKKRRKK
jgi:hypothetical protein